MPCTAPRVLRVSSRNLTLQSPFLDSSLGLKGIYSKWGLDHKDQSRIPITLALSQGEHGEGCRRLNGPSKSLWACRSATAGPEDPHTPLRWWAG